MAEVNLAEIKFGGAVGDRQTAKLISPPIFRLGIKCTDDVNNLVRVIPYVYIHIIILYPTHAAMH